MLSCSLCKAQFNNRYFYYVGYDLIVNDKNKEAVDVLNVLLRSDTLSQDAFFLRGIAKYNLKDIVGAEHDFSIAVKINPVFSDALKYRAMTRTYVGNFEGAISDLNNAIDIRPDQDPIFYNRGITYLFSQQFDLAIADFDYYIRRNPQEINTYINRGTCYLMKKDTVAALNDYNKVVDINNRAPEGYYRRGVIYMGQNKYNEALDDFSKAIELDSAHMPSYFNRALSYSRGDKPLKAIEDLTNVIGLDTTSSLAYFNRALLYSQIGEYNRALVDYNRVAHYTPNNVLLYFNRGGLNAKLGSLENAEADFTKAIELYPDFANAYLNRANIRYYLDNRPGAESDTKIANAKIVEYKSKLTDSTFSVYADTSKTFNKLLAFDVDFGNKEFDNIKGQKVEIKLMSMARFVVSDINVDEQYRKLKGSDNGVIADFTRRSSIKGLLLTSQNMTISDRKLTSLNEDIEDKLEKSGGGNSQLHFEKGVMLYSLKQYTNSIKSYTKAIAEEQTNAFLYMSRAVANSDMIDFISSIDNNDIKMSLDVSDPSSQQLKRIKHEKRVYNYDEALSDINKAIAIMPNIAQFYYNRANILCQAGDMPGAIVDYTKAIELYPFFAEAYYNRGLIQIYLQDTRKGCMDVSKAGELGVDEAYTVLQKYNKMLRNK